MHRAIIILIISIVAMSTGCVSKNTHQQKLNEIDLLSQDIDNLKETNSSIINDKADLKDSLSKLNNRLITSLQQNSKLQRDLLASNANQERQEGNLTKHQQQLADLQQSNEQLLTTVEELNYSLEKEKIAKEARLAKIKNTYNQLVGALEDEIKRGELTISNLEGQLSVNLLNQILFDSGETDIKEDGKKVLKSLGDVLGKFPDKALQVAGHTDNVQISARLREIFPSNWELSTARATSVVHFLQQQVGLPGERMIAAGYGEYHPIASNDTAEGKAENRRIQILLVPLK